MLCNKMKEKNTDFILLILMPWYLLYNVSLSLSTYCVIMQSIQIFLLSAKYSLKLECKIVFVIFVKVLKSLLIRLINLYYAICKLAKNKNGKWIVFPPQAISVILHCISDIFISS